MRGAATVTRYVSVKCVLSALQNTHTTQINDQRGGGTVVSAMPISQCREVAHRPESL